MEIHGGNTDGYECSEEGGIVYLDLEGLAFFFLALAIVAVGAGLWPTTTDSLAHRKSASGLAMLLAVIAAIISVVD